MRGSKAGHAKKVFEEKIPRFNLFINIVVPSTKPCEFQPECIESVVRQTYENWEIHPRRHMHHQWIERNHRAACDVHRTAVPTSTVSWTWPGYECPLDKDVRVLSISADVLDACCPKLKLVGFTR